MPALFISFSVSGLGTFVITQWTTVCGLFHNSFLPSMYLSPFNRLLRILWGHHFFFLIGLLLFTVGSPLPGNLAQELLGVGQDEVCIGVQGCPLKAFHYSAHCPQSQWTPAPPDTVYQESES